MNATFRSAWDVLLLFLIPVGGGIPAGVVLAKSRGFHWPTMAALYFVSDVILACIFEPCMLLVIAASRRSRFVARWREAQRRLQTKQLAHLGTSAGPLSLIAVAFGIDPMTGRAAAVAAGHGFVTGWMLAIAGDMLYFALIMVSTLFLNRVLGDGTWTTILITLAMLFGPALLRRLRGRRRAPATSP